MSERVQVSDLTLSELGELLANEGAKLSDDQLRGLAEFISNVGGMENALAALEQITNASRAA